MKPLHFLACALRHAHHLHPAPSPCHLAVAPAESVPLSSGVLAQLRLLAPPDATESTLALVQAALVAWDVRAEVTLPALMTLLELEEAALSYAQRSGLVLTFLPDGTVRTRCGGFTVTRRTSDSREVVWRVHLPEGDCCTASLWQAAFAASIRGAERPA